MKKLFAILLLVCMVFTLCACGAGEIEVTENENDQAATSGQQSTKPVETDPTEAPTDPEPTETEPQGVTYTIKVVDEGGNPVPGMMVQLCAESCMPRVTDADGNAIYENQVERSDYKASVTVYAEGYEAASEQVDYYFGEGNYEVTITVKAVA